MSGMKRDSLTTTASVKMGWALRDEIQKIADVERRTLSDQCVILLEMGLKIYAEKKLLEKANMGIPSELIAAILDYENAARNKIIERGDDLGAPPPINRGDPASKPNEGTEAVG